MAGRALLLGASEYGEGFANLPASRNDIKLVEEVLRSRRFNVDIAADEIVGTVSNLDDAIIEFCKEARDEINITNTM